MEPFVIEAADAEGRGRANAACVAGGRQGGIQQSRGGSCEGDNKLADIGEASSGGEDIGGVQFRYHGGEDAGLLEERGIRVVAAGTSDDWWEDIFGRRAGIRKGVVAAGAGRGTEL